MASQYAVQHEFDDEPTYVVHDRDAELNDEDCVAFGSQLPVELRLRLARIVCDEMNRVGGGQPIRRDRSGSSALVKPQDPSSVVISVAGGVVQEVYAALPATQVILIDWDTDGTEEGTNLVEFQDERGKRVRAWVTDLATHPLPSVDSDVGRALAAAQWISASPSPEISIRDPATLSNQALVRFAQRMQAVFYLDIQDDREFWNPDKEWEGADLLDELAQVMHQFGLVPPRIADAPL